MSDKPADVEALRKACDLAFDAWLDDAGSLDDLVKARKALLDAAPALPVPNSPGTWFAVCRTGDSLARVVRRAEDRSYQAWSHLEGWVSVANPMWTWSIKNGKLVEAPELTEWQDTQTPCTCGSGGHPRKCKRHPLRFKMHCAELDAAAREEERLDTLRESLAQAEAKCDKAEAQLAAVREVVERMCKTTMSSALHLEGAPPVVVTSHWAGQLCIAFGEPNNASTMSWQPKLSSEWGIADPCPPMPVPPPPKEST